MPSIRRSFVCYICLVSLVTAYAFLLSYKVELPTFKVSSTSATVKDISGNQVTANLALVLVVRNVNEWGVMLYDNINASVFRNNNPRLFHDGALLPFKQGKLDVREVDVSLGNTAVEVDYVITTNGRKSGVAFLNFELKAFLSFSGSTWVKPWKTPIEVVCEDVRVQFSSGLTTNFRFSTLLDCRVDAAWRKNVQLPLTTIAGVVVALAYLYFIIVYVLKD